MEELLRELREAGQAINNMVVFLGHANTYITNAINMAVKLAEEERKASADKGG